MLRDVAASERITISLAGSAAARVRRCAATDRRGASGYIERLIAADALQEAVHNAAAWYAAHPGYAEDAERERVLAELDETDSS